MTHRPKPQLPNLHTIQKQVQQWYTNTMHKQVGVWVKHIHAIGWKKLALWSGAGLFALLMLVQLLYPSDRLLPFTVIDSQPVGMRTKQQATTTVNAAYSAHTLQVYMGIDTKAFSTPTLKQADITIDNTERIAAMNYPWYMRVIPTSIFWAGFKQSDTPTPTYGKGFEKYVDATLMTQCKKAPVDATLRPVENKLVAVPAQPGGECERDDVLATLKQARPVLGGDTTVRVAQMAIAPAVGDKVAIQLADEINDRVTSGVQVMVNGAVVVVPTKDVLGWLDFASDDGSIIAMVNVERATAYLGGTIAPKVAIKPGVSYITTVDFTETSRQNGANGQALDIAATAASFQRVIMGEQQNADAVTRVVPPTEQYTRTYSPTDAGLNALLANYAKDHSGTFGISLIELDGKKRRANYNGDTKFVTASTYKLLVAYSLLKRVDSGAKSWDSIAECFNKMISVSDNACAEAFLQDVGLRNITNEVNAIGLKNSNFSEDGGPFTTANDLALLLGMLQSGQNFSAANRDRLITAMKGNIFRRGVPSGVSGVVANKVGFLDGLLHDASIVYSPSGTYVLVVMSKGSSWETIADLAKQVDTLRAQ